ncbi:MAG: hypothetical protein A2350_17410, partial [Candidatus Raymondbacteria bacterium RifOxyB12_full_50_8]
PYVHTSPCFIIFIRVFEKVCFSKERTATMPCGKKRKKHKINVHKLKKRRRKNRHKKKRKS